jgi:tRNA dimethylallyltransferase
MFDPIYIVGPTGSGKSAVALEFAQRCDGEIINGDAFQVYRELPILTAQPSASDRAQVPHHLYGSLSVSEDFDAATYVSLAQTAISEIQSRGKLPIIVGGSGMYLKALTHGLPEVPPVDEALRSALLPLSLDELVAQLIQKDPEAAAHVNLQNPRHVQRALEICLLTGKPASAIKQSWKTLSQLPRGIFLNPERDWLYDRINQRTHLMMAAGVRAEAQAAAMIGKTAAKTLGLAELRSPMSDEACIESIQQATRRYAKRQVTWFKRETYFQSVSDAARGIEILSQLIA